MSPQELFETGQPWVYCTAHRMPKWLTRHVGFDDLVQVGLIALWRASRYWKVEKKVAFRTYAIRAIRNSMWREAQQSMVIRPPMTLKWDSWFTLSRSFREGGTNGLPHDDPGPMEVDTDDYADEVRGVVSSVEGREGVALRYWLAGEPLKQIGVRLGISPAWAQQLKEKALRQVREQLQETEE